MSVLTVFRAKWRARQLLRAQGKSLAAVCERLSELTYAETESLTAEISRILSASGTGAVPGLARAMLHARGCGFKAIYEGLRHGGAVSIAVADSLARTCGATTDDNVMANAVSAMDKLAECDVCGSPELVVPAMARALGHRIGWVRRGSAEILGKYGARAKQAEAALIKNLSMGPSAKSAAEALDRIVGLDELPPKIRFRALIALVDFSPRTFSRDGQISDPYLQRAIQLGPEHLPILENMILSVIPESKHDYRSNELLNSAIAAYACLGGSPGGELDGKIMRLDKMEMFDDLVKRRGGPATVNVGAQIRRIRSGSEGIQKDAIEACIGARENQNELVVTLSAVAGNPGPNRVAAIECLGSLGNAARSVLPALMRLAQEAGRPVTREDFREQEELLGGLRDHIWERIRRGDPVSPELLRAAQNAIHAITTGGSGS
jgi:hypothetical protein